jgi:hypothetical protein
MKKYNELETGRTFFTAGSAACKVIAGEEITEEERKCMEEAHRRHEEFKQIHAKSGKDNEG